MERQLRLVLPVVLGLILVGCGKNEEDEKAYLNAPGVTKRITAEQANKDRGISPELAKQMAEPANHGGAKR